MHAAPTKTITLDNALRPIGKTPDALVKLLGSVLDAGPTYLVGSLAAGLGSSKSDVDIHVFSDEVAAAPGAPVMFFLDDTIVDVMHFRPANVIETCARVPTTSVPWGEGRCALGGTLTRRQQARLGRWTTAVPIGDAAPILPAERNQDVGAAAVRGALGEFTLLHALAHLAEDAGAPTAPGIWRAAARSLLEVACRTRGQLYVGRKWIWAKARLAGFPNTVLEVVDAARSGDCLGRAADALRLPIFDEPLRLLTLVPVTGSPVPLAGQDLVLVEDRWIHDRADLLSGPAAEEADRVGPAALLQALGAGATLATIDDVALDSEVAS